MNKTPKLRFKEFSGDWESKKLGTIGEFFKGSTLSKSHLSEEGKPCILYGELYTKYGEVIKNVISTTDLDDSKLVIGQKNDVLIPSSGETAIDIATASCLQQDNVILGGDLNVFRSDRLNGIFASYQLNNSKRYEIAKLAQGASVVHVYNNQLTKLKLSVPSKEEQDKIASLFSLIDDKISLQGDKVEALKDYKNGMMQKIFSRELRFKDDDGRAYPEWEDKRLGEIFSFQYGQFNNNPDNGGKYPIYGANGVIGGYNEYNAEKSIIIGHMGAYAGKVLWEERKHFVTYNGIIGKPKDNKTLISKFGYHMLLNKNIQKICAGSGQPFLSYNDLNNIKIVCSTNILEQNKIATFLTDLDIKLEKEQEKLDFFKEYKKGLLQQMFV